MYVSAKPFCNSMSKFALNYIHYVRVSNSSVLSTLNLCFLQSLPFSSSSSSSLKNIKNSSIGSSFTVNYLINSCGLTPKEAVSASKSVNFETPDKPDSVLSFFKRQGFTKTQIVYIANHLPNLLLCNPEKTVLPKLEFFKSKGASSLEVAEIVSMSPTILRRSLKNHLIPSFEFYSKLVQSNDKTIIAIKRFRGVLLLNLEIYLVPNIELLKSLGVSDRNIGHYLKLNPRTLMSTCDKFRPIVENVKKMGFDASKLIFLSAVHALRSMSKSTWDRKVEVYKKWGWSDDDIFSAFKKNTWCMTFSVKKLNSVMDFWVNKMGWESSFLANRPVLMAYSLHKRIVPRCEVYKALVSKGLIKSGCVRLTGIIESPDKQFFEKFINCYEKEAPKLLKLYKEKMNVEK